MSVICVTGQMAAGKNYICSQYEKDGWISVDADKVVHEAVEASKPQIIETFGEIAKSKGVELLDADGKIIRRNLGSLIFGSAELLKKQEDIVYPYVTEYVKKFLNENKSKNIIINAVALYKTPELLNLCEKVVYVKSFYIKRLIRAHRRDGLPVGKIIARFKSQKGLLERYKESGVKIEIVKN